MADLGPGAHADSQALEKRDGGLGVAQRSLEIAADICVFTNRNIVVESL